jgi:hypothetical protein
MKNLFKFDFVGEFREPPDASPRTPGSRLGNVYTYVDIHPPDDPRLFQ